MEEEKKIHSTIISDLEDRLNLLTVREEDWRKRIEELTNERNFGRHQIDVLQMGKEEMVKEHTIETGELRKKNNYLENQLQKMETLIEQNNISSGNPGGAYEEYGFDDMDMNFWADPCDFPPPETKTALVKKSEAGKAQEVGDADKPAASGLLLIVRLFPSNFFMFPANHDIAPPLWRICRFIVFFPSCYLTSPTSPAN